VFSASCACQTYGQVSSSDLGNLSASYKLTVILTP